MAGCGRRSGGAGPPADRGRRWRNRAAAVETVRRRDSPKVRPALRVLGPTLQRQCGPPPAALVRTPGMQRSLRGLSPTVGPGSPSLLGSMWTLGRAQYDAILAGQAHVGVFFPMGLPVHWHIEKDYEPKSSEAPPCDDDGPACGSWMESR